MQKKFSPFRLALCALCLLSLFGLRAYGQEKDRDQTSEHANGIVQDWSRRHLAYPRVGPIKSMIALQNDPRAILSWQEQTREDWHRERNRHHHRDHDNDQDDTPSTASGLHRDWSIPLGSGSTAPAMFPAKFGFDPTATVSFLNGNCTSDFIVYPVNVTGGSGQPNIVAFDQLYSGTVGGTGICNRAPVIGVDDGVSATTMWSYDVHAAGGQVPTSPALSLDGTKVAFVESASATTAHFHVLAGRSGDGVPANHQTVTSALTISSFTDPLAPAAGSGTASDLILTPVSGTASDTLSSPFIEYNSDTAYIGNDSGTLFRVRDVFCPTTVPVINPACSGLNPPAPSLDTTWPTSGPSMHTGTLATGCPGRLTGPVVAGTGNVFVGCSDGTLYGFTPTGSAIPGSPLTVGNGGATGGIVDPPLVDVVNGFLYVGAGNSSGTGTPSVLVQAGTTSFTTPTPVVATLGAGGVFNLHAPSFNAAYFSGGTALLYDWAVNGSNQVAVYGVGFGAGQAMTSGPAGNVFAVSGSTGNELSPTTEFLNGTTDQLFVCGIAHTNPNFVEYNINTFPAAFPPLDGSNAVGATINEGTGTSGMVVDNSSGSGQASSIYFGVLGAAAPNGNSAVKLTQSGLN